MPDHADAAGDFRQLWDELTPIGRDRNRGGYARFAWTAVDAELRAWFTTQAEARGLEVEVDRSGNQWAWWGRPGPDAVVTGSHLDSVPSGGAYDGPLGVVSALLAVDELRARGVEPARPFAVVNFVEEEGARFGIACLGSRLLTGALAPEKALALRDQDGLELAAALTTAGHAPERIGPDRERLARIGVFVELHVEQGRALIERGSAIGVADSIWPHGRYRFDFRGRADHAGTTRMEDRADPMLTYAHTVLAANERAAASGQRATFGRVEVTPNGTNAIPSHVTAWLDARCTDDDTLAELVATIERETHERARRDGTLVEVSAESVSAAVRFSGELAGRLGATAGGEPWPILPTQAGHDAGILAGAGVPSAMLFVRNPTGVSHSPDEFAEDADCVAGITGLADVLAGLLAEGEA